MPSPKLTPIKINSTKMDYEKTPPPAPCGKYKKASSKRCYKCNKKLSIVERQLKCKCFHSFCSKHRLARFSSDKNDDGHKCPYDFHSEGKNNLCKKLFEGKIVNQKMDKL